MLFRSDNYRCPSGSGGAGGNGGGGAGAMVSGWVLRPFVTGGIVNATLGGGGASNPSTGGTGGSGVVIIRYPGSQTGSGGTVTNVGGYTIHTFTTSGTYTA